MCEDENTWKIMLFLIFSSTTDDLNFSITNHFLDFSCLAEVERNGQD